MKRARLRVKTGCLTCRKRRKKCDQIKPVCGDCLRLQLPCAWPTLAEDAPTSRTASSTQIKLEDEQQSRVNQPQSVDRSIQRSHRVLPAPSVRHEPALYQLVSGLVPQFRNDLERHMFTSTGKVLSMMICPVADDSCRELSRFLCVSLQKQWSRDAIMAFTASFFAAQDDNMSLTATGLYQSAIGGLKANLLDHGSTDMRQMLLVATNSLGLIETLCSGDEEKAIHHFAAAGQFLTMEAAANRLPQDTPSQTMYRVIAECVIFNIGSLALFYPRLSSLARVLDWSSYEFFFQQDPKFLKSPYSNSPFLGGRRDMYRVMFAISWLGQCTIELGPRRQQYVHMMKYEVEHLQRSLESYYSNDVSAAVRMLYTIKYQLHIFAMQIFILKINRPGICAAHRDIATVVSQSLSLLRAGTLDEVYNPSLCWPLTVLLCAVHEAADFEGLVERTVAMQAQLGAGHATRMGKIIARLAWIRNFSVNPCIAELDEDRECNGKHDGLSLLLQRGGLT